jgi:hypothetical protein
MAKIFLTPNETFNLGANSVANFVGNSGAERVSIVSGNVIIADQNVERIDLPNASSSYQFALAGNEVKIYTGTTLVATYYAGGTGQVVAFSNGSAALVMNGLNAVTLGGVAIPAVAATIAPAVITSDISSSATGGSNNPSNLPFTLTTGVDNLVGTSGNDTFVADNTGVTAVLSGADILNGGDGTDTINIFSVGTAFNLPTFTSIETANIYDQNASQNISTSNWSSVNTVNLIRGDGDLTVTVGANVGTVSLTEAVLDGASGAGAAAGVVLAFAAAATAATVNLNNITTLGTAADENVDINGAALTTVTINTSGTKSTFDLLDVASATTINLNAAVALTTVLETGATAATLNITGAGAVDLGTLDTAINTINASTATGGITATIGAAVVDTVFTGSAGNDVITASGADTLATTDALSVNAGAGTGDILIIAATADVDTAADGARYTGFETLRLADSQDVSLIAGITAIQLDATTSETISGLSATQASDITVRDNQTTALTLTLATASGSSDAVTLKLASETAANNVDVAGLSVIGVETLNINATTGTAGTTSDLDFASGGADKLTAVNITGSAETTLSATNSAKAITVNATAAGKITVSGDFIVGSTINGSTAAINTFTVGGSDADNGSTYNGGNAADSFTSSVALLVANGTKDTVLNGGAGIDTLTISDTVATLTDNHFTFLTGFEKIVTSTGITSITTGAGFNTAFATGVTITTGTLSATEDFTYSGGLYGKNTTVVIDATSLTGATTEDINVTTGAGDDTVTVTGDAIWQSAAADGATIAIITGAGVDTISVTIGTMNAQTTSNVIDITAGAGADIITKVGTNSTTVQSTADFIFAAGDSGIAARDKITGFDVAGGTNLSDLLNFDGTAAVSAFSATVDYGVILSHSITAGVVLFDDAAAYSSALVINATNLGDVLGYLAANTATDGTVAFAYDSDASGTADATLVFHNGTTDDLVELVGITSVAALTATTNTATANYIAIA